ncbi:MAG: RNase P subunit p30 family protein [Candidatus Thorarchaeota archaeon]
MSIPLDLNVNVTNRESIDSYVEFAQVLGIRGIAVQTALDHPIVRLDDGFLLLKRHNLTGKTSNTMMEQLKKARYGSAIISVPLRDVSTANWAAEEHRVDLISLVAPFHDNVLRDSTAKLAASTGTALEISFAPLLSTNGMTRAKILKAFRETAKTAISARMPIVISSDGNSPLEMRSPLAMQHIGLLFGINGHLAGKSVNGIPSQIIERNERRLGEDFIAEGIEIVKRSDSE